MKSAILRQSPTRLLIKSSMINGIGKIRIFIRSSSPAPISRPLIAPALVHHVDHLCTIPCQARQVPLNNSLHARKVVRRLPAYMRSDENIGRRVKRMSVWKGLRIRHIECRATDLAGLESIDKRILVDVWSARNIGDKSLFL